jgi:hypothetical protein
MALLLTRQPYAMYCETRHTRTQDHEADDRSEACIVAIGAR